MIPYTQKEETTGPDAHGTWLVSFADLLTLLLCAFLMMFSYTWEESSRVPKVSNFESGNSKTKSHGIVIAHSPLESLETKALERGLEVRFSREDFKDDGISLRERAARDLKSIVISDRYSNTAVFFKVCATKQPPTTSSEMRTLLQKLGGQLIDAGVTAQRIRYEVYGAGCEGTGETIKAVARFLNE